MFSLHFVSLSIYYFVSLQIANFKFVSDLDSDLSNSDDEITAAQDQKNQDEDDEDDEGAVVGQLLASVSLAKTVSG